MDDVDGSGAGRLLRKALPAGMLRDEVADI